MEHSPLVSIITVSFNSEKTIRKTIESVLGQTYSRMEYLIVDGASTDQTVSIAQEYNQAFEERGVKYRIISEKDNGIYDAMNKGIERSTGELIGIINSDDWYEPIAVETAVESYRQTSFNYFYADIRLHKDDGKTMIKHSRETKIATSHHWNHPTSFVTRQTYQDLGVFRCEGIHDDFEYYLRVKKSGKKIVVKNVVTANFKMGGTSNDKRLSKCRQRCRDRYRSYRVNGYTPLYGVECIAIEAAKYILG